MITSLRVRRYRARWALSATAGAILVRVKARRASNADVSLIVVRTHNAGIIIVRTTQATDAVRFPVVTS